MGLANKRRKNVWGAIAGNGLQILEKVESPIEYIKYANILENNVKPAFREFHYDLDLYDPKHESPRSSHIMRNWFANITDISRMDMPPICQTSILLKLMKYTAKNVV